MRENVLVSWVGSVEGVQGVHVAHVPPQCGEVGRNIKSGKMLSSDPDVLKFWHQFAVKTAHSVPGQEPFSLFRQVLVDPPQLGLQVRTAPIILVDEHLLELGVDILDDTRHLLVLGGSDSDD